MNNCYYLYFPFIYLFFVFSILNQASKEICFQTAYDFMIDIFPWNNKAGLISNYNILLIYIQITIV